MSTALVNDAWDFLRAQRSKPLNPYSWTKTSQIRLFSGSKDLNSFSCEIFVEPGESKARAIDGWFPNFSVKPDVFSFQFEMELFSVQLKKAIDCDHRHFPGAPLAGGSRLNNGLVAH